MDYEVYREGMAFATEHIKEYGVEWARDVIEGIYHPSDRRTYMSDYAKGYLDAVELAEAIMGKGEQR